MYGDMGRGIDVLFKTMIAGLIISVPLAIWKLFEIGVWLWNNVKITIH